MLFRKNVLFTMLNVSKIKIKYIDGRAGGSVEGVKHNNHL